MKIDRFFSNENNSRKIESKVNQISEMKQKQAMNIDNGFKQIFKRLEEKKEDLIHQFTQRYDQEIK